MGYWLAPYYMFLALLDVVAAFIACYVVFRIGKLYASIRESWLSFLVAGYALLAIALVASAISYGIATSEEFWHTPGTHPHGPSWHHETMEWGYGVPPHWAYGASGRGVSPFWVGIEALLLISYVLILASVLTGRVEVGESGIATRTNTVLGFVGLGLGIVVGLGLNIASAAVLLVAAALVVSEGKGIPSAGVGYVLLAVSHVVEVLAIQYLSADLMLIAEGLRPVALLVIGAGVGARGRHG